MMRRWQLAGSALALYHFPDSNEVLAYDTSWSETHLVNELVAHILEILKQRSECSEREIAGLLELDGSQEDMVLNYLRELEKLNLVVEVPGPVI